MRKILWTLILIACFILISCQNYQTTETLENKDVDISISSGMFLPQLVSVSGSIEGTCTLELNRGNFFFSRSDQAVNDGLPSIYKMNWEDDSWKQPELFIYTGDSKNFNPCVTEDGQYILFYRMYGDDNKTGTYYIEKTQDGYSEPKFLIDAYCVSTADFKTFYASPIKGPYKDDLVMFELDQGKYSEMQQLSISSDAIEIHPFISPDQSYLLFDSNREGIMGSYISYKTNDSWGKPILIGENMSNPSTDGVYLFYHFQGDIYANTLDEVLIKIKERSFYDQELPGKVPIIFSEGVVSRDSTYQYPPSFSSNGDFMIYGEMDEKRNRGLLVVENENSWSQPKSISFTEADEMEASISKDGKRIYFASSLDSTNAKPSNLYYVNYDNGIFSEPVRLPETINSSHLEYYVTDSLSGNLYFTREGIGIFKSEYIEGKYLESKKLNLEGISYASHPYISKDESFLLFDARQSGNYGSADIYISFNSEKGFTEPVNLGDSINTSDWDAMAMLSPNEDYLFFVRESNEGRDIYWVEFNANDFR